MLSKAARIALCASLLVGTHIVSAPVSFAQNADVRLQEYSDLLDRIANIRIETAQKEVMVANQEGQISSLQDQIAKVPDTKAAVKDIALKMSAEIEKQIEQDIPFRLEERNERLGFLIGLVSDPAATGPQIYRRALGVIEIESNYGNSVSAYTGDHPTTPGRRLAACRENIESPVCNLTKDTLEKIEGGATIDDLANEIKDGNYVHFGRMSLAYLDLDSREGFRWNEDAGESGDWEPLSSGDILNTRRAIRVAKGESAPGVVTAPVKIEAAQ